MDDEALERLEMRIDSKEGSEPVERRALQRDSDVTPRAWQARVVKRRRILPAFLTRLSPLEMLFAGSIIFFIGAGSIASLLIFSGSNTVSTRNVDVAVAGPTSIRAGEEVTMQVVITNRNAVPMNLTDLLIEFPTGTRSPKDVSIDLLRSRESLGTIDPGASVNRTVKAVMFGQSGVPVAVTVTAEYRVPSSNAVFQSSSVYNATISQSPASITVDTLKEVVSGQSTDLTVKVVSNATENLTGMLLVATYPPGFTFESSAPKPVSGSSVWDLGDIEPKGERTIVIHGTFTGEDGDDRVIHFTSGTKKKDDAATIAAPLAASDAALKVAKPFVSVQLALKGVTTGTVNAERGEIVQGEVRWANNLPVRVQNVQIEIKLNGAILNKGSVRTGQGFFRSADTTILFNKDSDPRFADVDPGATGVSTFEFATLPTGQGTFQSPQVVLNASVKANRSSEGGVIDVVQSSATATLQVATDLALTPVLTRVSGPVPPKVDKETEYAITWLLTNSANAIANTAITAVLPAYVTWKSGSSPDVVYNENGRTVTWTIGDVNANASKSVSFNVLLTPSITQVNNIVTLLGDQRITAFDRFIRTAIERPQLPITTQTGTTPQMGVVVP